MFGLGYQELLIILVIVLVLFGANRLPELARSLGSSVKEFQKGVNEGREGGQEGGEDGGAKGRGEEGVASLIGVDLGGTRVRAGAVTVDGRLTSQTEALTQPHRGPDAVIETVRRAIATLAGQLNDVTA